MEKNKYIEEQKQKVAEILRSKIHFSPQLESYVIHGAIEDILVLLTKAMQHQKELDIKTLEKLKPNCEIVIGSIAELTTACIDGSIQAIKNS